MANKLTDEQREKIYELSVNPDYQREKRTGFYRKTYELVSNHSKIAEEVGCSVSTVSRVLNPSQILKNRIIQAEYARSENGKKILRRSLKKFHLKNYLDVQRGIRALAVLMDELDNK